MDRPFKPKYGTVSQVLLQLVVVMLESLCKNLSIINWSGDVVVHVK